MNKLNKIVFAVSLLSAIAQASAQESVAMVSDSGIPPTTLSMLEGLNMSRIGFGALQLSYPEMDIDTATALLEKAIAEGCTFFDTAAAYGLNRHNEQLLGQIIGSNSSVVISTKCGIDFVTGKYTQSPSEIEESVNISLKNLRRDYLDILYLHRIDPSASPEKFVETISCLKNLVVKGKVRYIGLSEPTQRQLLDAMEVEPKSIPISTVQCAYSLFTRRAEQNGVLDTCKQHGILFVSYTSVLRGLADSRLKAIKPDDVEHLPINELKERVFQLLNLNSMVQTVGWFDDKYIRENIRLSLRLISEAENHNVTPAQLVLMWSVENGILPIPATTNKLHLSENLAVLNMNIGKDLLKRLGDIFPCGAFGGIPNPQMLTTFNNDHLL